MIEGDEGKPMTLLEFISDEPVDCEPFLEYAIDHMKGRMAYFAAFPVEWRADQPPPRDCLVAQVDQGLRLLEDALMKLRRERARGVRQV